jgi:hypothetical protein
LRFCSFDASTISHVNISIEFFVGTIASQLWSRH